MYLDLMLVWKLLTFYGAQDLDTDFEVRKLFRFDLDTYIAISYDSDASISEKKTTRNSFIPASAILDPRNKVSFQMTIRGCK